MSASKALRFCCLLCVLLRVMPEDIITNVIPYRFVFNDADAIKCVREHSQDRYLLQTDKPIEIVVKKLYYVDRVRCFTVSDARPQLEVTCKTNQSDAWHVTSISPDSILPMTVGTKLSCSYCMAFDVDEIEIEPVIIDDGKKYTCPACTLPRSALEYRKLWITGLDTRRVTTESGNLMLKYVFYPMEELRIACVKDKELSTRKLQLSSPNLWNNTALDNNYNLYLDRIDLNVVLTPAHNGYSLKCSLKSFGGRIEYDSTSVKFVLMDDNIQKKHNIQKKLTPVTLKKDERKEIVHFCDNYNLTLECQFKPKLDLLGSTVTYSMRRRKDGKETVMYGPTEDFSESMFLHTFMLNATFDKEEYSCVEINKGLYSHQIYTSTVVLVYHMTPTTTTTSLSTPIKPAARARGEPLPDGAAAAGAGGGAGGNEVTDCQRYEEQCEALECPSGVVRVPTEDGCERCVCAPPPLPAPATPRPPQPNCTVHEERCRKLECPYGVERTDGGDGCDRCSCLKHPCAKKRCPEDERCVPIPHVDRETKTVHYTSDCGIMRKAGTCPVEEPRSGGCRRECNDDADCRGADKCCTSGCRHVCLPPVGTTTTALYTSTTPEPPSAPVPNIATEPEVVAELGGKVTLRCLFHGNPSPKITWRRGEITIDGDRDRYRLLSDGALEIAAVYRNDSGVYICIARNDLGTTQQEVTLIVQGEDEVSEMCTRYEEECRQLQCYYGMQRTTDENGCQRCHCSEHPCYNKYCPEGERCIPTPYRDYYTKDIHYNATCRTARARGEPLPDGAAAAGAGGGAGEPKERVRGTTPASGSTDGDQTNSNPSRSSRGGAACRDCRVLRAVIILT